MKYGLKNSTTTGTEAEDIRLMPHAVLSTLTTFPPALVLEDVDGDFWRIIDRIEIFGHKDLWKMFNLISTCCRREALPGQRAIPLELRQEVVKDLKLPFDRDTRVGVLLSKALTKVGERKGAFSLPSPRVPLRHVAGFLWHIIPLKL